MRIRTWLLVAVILAMLATAAAIGVAGVVASRDGWLEGLRDLSFAPSDAYVQRGPEIRKDFPVDGALAVDVQIDDGDVRIVGGGVRATVVVTPTIVLMRSRRVDSSAGVSSWPGRMTTNSGM